MDKDIEQEMEIDLAVVLPNAVAHPLAMVIHHKDALLTTSAVVVTRRLQPPTY
jgi:hypothetical protein